MAFTVTGLDGWAIPDLRIAVYSPRNTHGRRLPRTAGWQAGWLTCRLTAPVHRQGFAKAMKDIPGGPRQATGQHRHLSRPFRRPPARAPENGGHPHHAPPWNPVADCAVISVQLDPVRHRPIAWTKLRMITVP
jgi:hypothetical protein